LQRLVLSRGYDPNMPTESSATHEQGRGGSVYVHELSSLFLNKVIFRDNNATNGGAIYSKKPKKVIITESTLTHNFALGSGGSM
jgi:predicted outer membrane repeat protein